jgi:hypothetical protein
VLPPPPLVLLPPVPPLAPVAVVPAVPALLEPAWPPVALCPPLELPPADLPPEPFAGGAPPVAEELAPPVGRLVEVPPSPPVIPALAPPWASEPPDPLPAGSLDSLPHAPAIAPRPSASTTRRATIHWAFERNDLMTTLTLPAQKSGH